jgi:hypothetical protein
MFEKIGHIHSNIITDQNKLIENVKLYLSYHLNSNYSNNIVPQQYNPHVNQTNILPE